MSNNEGTDNEHAFTQTDQENQHYKSYLLMQRQLWPLVARRITGLFKQQRMHNFFFFFLFAYLYSVSFVINISFSFTFFLYQYIFFFYFYCIFYYCLSSFTLFLFSLVTLFAFFFTSLPFSHYFCVLSNDSLSFFLFFSL